MSTSTSIGQGNDVVARLALVFGVGLFVVAVYWQTYASLYLQWNQSDHAHGLVIIPIVAFLIFRCREPLAESAVRSSGLGVIAVVMLVLLWVVARLASLAVVEHFAALALIPACVFSVFGRELTGRIAFPLFFLIFAWPISDLLVPYLMLITADISTFLLRLFGIPVFREGQYLTLRGGSFVVADVCSGVRYLMAGLIVASLFAYTQFRSYTRRCLFVAVTGLVLVLANGFRAFVVMGVASATEMKYLGGRDHIIFGWLLFAIIVFGVLRIGARYAEEEQESVGDPRLVDKARTGSRDTPLLAAALIVGMLVITFRPYLGDHGAYVSLGAIGILLVGATLAVGMISSGDASSGGGENSGSVRSVKAIAPAVVVFSVLFSGPIMTGGIASAPDAVTPELEFTSIDGCVGPLPWREDWQPVLVEAASKQSVSFECGGATISVFVAAFSNPEPGADLISTANRLYPKQWDRYKSGFQLAQIANSTVRDVLQQTVDLPSRQVRTWHWYSIDGYRETSKTMVKLRQLWALIRQMPAGGTVVIVVADGAENAIDTERLMNLIARQIPSAGDLD